VLCGNGGEKLLLLAEGLLRKHVAAHSLHEPEAVMVYISILEQQEKYGDALEILTGNLGSLLMVEVDKLRILGRLLARSADYDAAAGVYEKILELCPDDWECFQHYLDCLMEDGRSLSNGPAEDRSHASGRAEHHSLPLADEVFNSRIARASSFVQKLLEHTGDNLIRCPYLANLELERRKQLYGKGNIDNLIELLVKYFLRFGHLACFASDVEEFLLVLSFDQQEFTMKLMKSSEYISPTPIKALGQSITILKIQELTGSMYRLPVDGLEDSSRQMVEMYCNNLTLSKDLDPQESMPGEELLSMSSNVLVQLYWHTGNLGYMLEAIMVLEFGLNIRRHVWQYKVLLLHLYSHLGIISLAYDWYKSLEVKNILLETVSHHIFPQMLVSPLWPELNNLLKEYLKFMDDHFRESADLTFVAYRHRNYSKVIEFVQFKDRLQRSNQHTIAGIEVSLLKLKQNAGNLAEEEVILDSLKYGLDLLDLSNEIRSKSLTFNEDLQSRPWWTPTAEKNRLLGPFEELSHFPRDDLMKEREARARTVIEKRSLLPRLIYLSIQNASAAVKESPEANGCDEPKTSLELKSLLERYAKILGYSLSHAIQLIGEVCRGLRSSEVFGSHLIDWVNLAVFCNAWKLTSTEFSLHSGEELKGGGWLVDSLLEKCILERIRPVDSRVDFPRKEMPILVQLVTEPLAWHGLIIQRLLRVSLPSGKKKKKGGPADQSSSPLLAAVRDSVQLLCAAVEEVIKQLKDQMKKLEEENLEELLSSLTKEGRDGGPGRVFRVLESTVSSASNVELGDRITEALKSWSPAEVSRKIVAGQRRMLREFLSICESKHKTFETLRKQNS
ncbi:hypothetical protein CRG98_024935, partial [Punica granatum]